MNDIESPSRKRPHEGDVPEDLRDTARMGKRQHVMGKHPSVQAPPFPHPSTPQAHAYPSVGMPLSYHQYGHPQYFGPTPVQPTPQMSYNQFTGQQPHTPRAQRFNASYEYHQQAYPYPQQARPVQMLPPDPNCGSPSLNTLDTQYMAESQGFQHQTRASSKQAGALESDSVSLSQNRLDAQYISDGCQLQQQTREVWVAPYRDGHHKAAIEFAASYMKELPEYQDIPREDVIAELRAQEDESNSASNNESENYSEDDDTFTSCTSSGHPAICIESNLYLQKIAENEADAFITECLNVDNQAKSLSDRSLNSAGQFALEQAAALCFGQDESFWGESGLVHVPEFGFICRPPTKEEEQRKEDVRKKCEEAEAAQVAKEKERKEQKRIDIEAALEAKRGELDAEHERQMSLKRKRNGWKDLAEVAAEKKRKLEVEEQERSREKAKKEAETERVANVMRQIRERKWPGMEGFTGYEGIEEDAEQPEQERPRAIEYPRQLEPAAQPLSPPATQSLSSTPAPLAIPATPAMPAPSPVSTSQMGTQVVPSAQMSSERDALSRSQNAQLYRDSATEAPPSERTPHSPTIAPPSARIPLPPPPAATSPAKNSPAPHARVSRPTRSTRQPANNHDTIITAQREIEELRMEKDRSDDPAEKKRIQARIRAREKKIAQLEAEQAEEDAADHFRQQQITNQQRQMLSAQSWNSPYMTPPPGGLGGC